MPPNSEDSFKMSKVSPSTRHQEVIKGLHDLQRRIRGDAAPPSETYEPKAAPVLAEPEVVSISEGDVQIVVTPEDETERSS